MCLQKRWSSIIFLLGISSLPFTQENIFKIGDYARPDLERKILSITPNLRGANYFTRNDLSNLKQTTLDIGFRLYHSKNTRNTDFRLELNRGIRATI